MNEGAQRAVDTAGANLTTASGQIDADNASQVTAIENMVTAGATGILITPGETKAIVPAIQNAGVADVEPRNFSMADAVAIMTGAMAGERVTRD
jgi:fructose transport system substrate-binding protein